MLRFFVVYFAGLGRLSRRPSLGSSLVALALNGKSTSDGSNPTTWSKQSQRAQKNVLFNRAFLGRVNVLSHKGQMIWDI